MIQKGILIVGLLFLVLMLFFLIINFENALTGKAFATNYIEGDQISNFNLADINSINYDSGIILVEYSFDASDYDSEDVNLDVWITNDKSSDLARESDYFSISSFNETKIIRNIRLNTGYLDGGLYYVNIALHDNQNNFKSQAFSIEGFSSLMDPKAKLIVYAIFLAIIAIGLFFILKGNKKFDGVEEKQKVR